LLSHLPGELLQPALRLLSRSMTAQVIAIVTLLGCDAEYAQKHKWKYLEDDLFATSEATVVQTG
jgi:hypothetical protein